MRLIRKLIVFACLFSVLASARAATEEPCRVDIELVDGQTGEMLPGMVQVVDQEGKHVELAALLNRGQGVEPAGPLDDWWVLTKRTEVTVPAASLELRAVAGLETELATIRVDLRGKTRTSIKIPLVRFHNARRRGYLAGNTHLHLKQMSKQQADRYLHEVPLADGLDIVFLSYLERAGADLEYTSNKYSPRDLRRMSDDHVRFGHGEEHRHNFGSHDEGYGHILLLDIPYLIQPVSIGPGITQTGTDSPPLQTGIDEARRKGGKVIWAHNLFGFEDIPNWVTGRVHANNIFDGSERGTYRDTYYRYLNVGLHVPFATGTDWFIYDFSRVYVMSDRAISPTQWLDLLAAGKSFITNGTLLEFSVDDQPLGSVLELAGPRKVAIRGRAVGRLDFQRIELIRNGQVLASEASRPEGGHFVAEMKLDLEIDSPSWLALRTPAPPVRDAPGPPEQVAINESGHALFAHTSPVYLRLANKGVFDRATATGLVEEMQADMKTIEAKAVFADDHQRDHVLEVYHTAIDKLRRQIDAQEP